MTGDTLISLRNALRRISRTKKIRGAISENLIDDITDYFYYMIKGDVIYLKEFEYEVDVTEKVAQAILKELSRMEILKRDVQLV